MNYLLDRKTKKNKFFYIVSFVVILSVLFYFRQSIFGSLSSLSHFIFRPVLVSGNSFGTKLNGISSYFVSKNSLYLENEKLKSELNKYTEMMENHDSVLAENISLKEMSGRSDEKVPMILSAILSKPSQSPYDTLIIDIGMKHGLKSGDIVFSLGNIPIGRVSDVYLNSSKVTLFSNSGERTQVVVGDKNIFMEIVGRGGGNFEMIMPRDFTVAEGDKVVLPGVFPYVLAIVETIISDPRDPFIKALLVSPVNIQELKFVQVENKK